MRHPNSRMQGSGPSKSHTIVAAPLIAGRAIAGPSALPAEEIEAVAALTSAQRDPDAAFKLVAVLLLLSVAARPGWPVESLWDALGTSLPPSWVKQIARWIAAQRDPVKAFRFVLDLIRAIIKDFNRAAAAQQRSYS